MTTMRLKKIVAGEYFYHYNSEPAIYIKHNSQSNKWELKVFKSGETKFFNKFREAKEYSRALFKLAQLFGRSK